MRLHRQHFIPAPRADAGADRRLDKALDRWEPEVYQIRTELLGRAMFGELWVDPIPTDGERPCADLQTHPSPQSSPLGGAKKKAKTNPLHSEMYSHEIIPS